MCEACRLGNAKAGSGHERGACRGIKIAQVPGTDVDGIDAFARAKDDADALAVEHQRCGRAALVAGIMVRSAQSRLCTTEGGGCEPQADVAGQAEAAWMREALAVANEDVGPLRQAASGGDDGGRFAEAQESRHIGKSGRGDDGTAFHDRVGRCVPDDDSGDQFPAVGGDGDVDAAEKAWRRGQGPEIEAIGKSPLKRRRGRWLSGPVVQSRQNSGHIAHGYDRRSGLMDRKLDSSNTLVGGSAWRKVLRCRSLDGVFERDGAVYFMGGALRFWDEVRSARSFIKPVQKKLRDAGKSRAVAERRLSESLSEVPKRVGIAVLEIARSRRWTANSFGTLREVPISQGS